MIIDNDFLLYLFFSYELGMKRRVYSVPIAKIPYLSLWKFSKLYKLEMMNISISKIHVCKVTSMFVALLFALLPS